jgi:DNA-binding MarR family transcriptional regulator
MRRDKADVFTLTLQRQLYKLLRAYETCSQTCLTMHGVTASQGYTLLALPEQGELSMNELSAAVGLANSTLTRYVDQLIRHELVARNNDPTDRRVVRVRLTERGQEVRRVLDESLQEFHRQILNEIGEEERPVLLHALEQITRTVTKLLKDACLCPPGSPD